MISDYYFMEFLTKIGDNLPDLIFILTFVFKQFKKKAYERTNGYFKSRNKTALFI